MLRRVYGRLRTWEERDVEEYWAPLHEPGTVAALMGWVRAYDWTVRPPPPAPEAPVPILAYFGARDRLIPAARAVAHAARIPRATSEIVPQGGHLLSEEAPELVWRALDRPLFVKPVATGMGDCSTWANACGLQTALGAAISGDEIWAQAGTYQPTSGADRTATFALKSGVAIYGGFAGTGTSRGQRHWVTNVTTLSGDIGAVGNNSDNSYHVVTGSGVDATAILDGFTITAVNADADTWPQWDGGGIYNTDASPTLAAITFAGNAADHGGGLYNNNSEPELTNCAFLGRVTRYRTCTSHSCHG